MTNQKRKYKFNTKSHFIHFQWIITDLYLTETKQKHMFRLSDKWVDEIEIKMSID